MSGGTHPAWCNRQSCDDRGGHVSRSRRITTPGDPVIPTVIECWLDQPLSPADGPVLLALKWSEGGIRQVYAISLTQARTLAWSLQQLVKQAAR